MIDSAHAHCVTPVFRTSLRQTYTEGWAPRQDYQKASRNQAKSDKERGPSKPLTIAPLAKK